MHNIFKDKTGQVIIGQKPNLPIIIWFLALIVSRLPLSDGLQELSSLIAFGALFTWSWLEIFDGVNTWRKILGSLVMCVLLLLSL